MAERKTSPLFYFGCGCASLAILVVGVFVGLGFMGKQWAEKFEEELKDPTVRQARAAEILGVDSLPEGWHAYMHLKVPFVMEMALLSDGEPPPDGQVPDDLNEENLGDNTFVFVNMRDMGDARSDLEKALETGVDPANVQMGFQSEEALGRGSFELAEGGIRWAAHRGNFSRQQSDGEGVYAIFAVDCNESDGRVRLGFYWRVLEEAGQTAGTPADEAELRRFLEQFKLCS